MTIPAENGPALYGSFGMLADHIKGLCNFDPSQSQNTPDRTFTGELPLGVDFRNAVPLAAVALENVVGVDPVVLRAWRDAWTTADGVIESICADQRNDDRRTDLFIAGPAINLEVDPSAHPALIFAYTMESTGSRVANIHAGLGLLDTDNQPVLDRWIDLEIPRDNLDLLGNDYVQALPNRKTIAGLAALAERATVVVAAAKDPLKGAIEQIKFGIITRADVMANPAAELDWRRASQSVEHRSAMEVCRVDVSTERYGRGRYLALARDSSKPEAVHIYTEDEWRAFQGGAQYGEFDRNS